LPCSFSTKQSSMFQLVQRLHRQLPLQQQEHSGRLQGTTRTNTVAAYRNKAEGFSNNTSPEYKTCSNHQPIDFLERQAQEQNTPISPFSCKSPVTYAVCLTLIHLLQDKRGDLYAHLGWSENSIHTHSTRRVVHQNRVRGLEFSRRSRRLGKRKAVSKERGERTERNV